MTDKEIERINFLARKARESGLSEEEKSEQAVLRRKYIDSVVGSLRDQLDNTKIMERDGTVKPLRKKGAD